MKKRMKKRKMKRKSYNLALFCCVLFFISCGTGEHLQVRIEMPRQTKIDLDNFDEIAIANFLVKEEAKDFNLNREIADYFAIELDQKAKKKISSLEVPLETEDVFEDKDFWRKQIPGKKRSIMFTGTLEFTQEIRKAIRSAEKRRFDDPFPEESRIEERRFFSLSLHLYLIDSQSGEAVYERTFKESESYRKPNQTAYFAFYDMMLNIRDKLFRQILREEQIQERYLIK